MSEIDTIWRQLRGLADEAGQASIADLFAASADRVERFTCRAAGIVADCSKNRLPEAGLSKLLGLAEAAHVDRAISAMVDGETINTTEGRAALHTALRDPRRAGVDADKRAAVLDTLAKMKALAAAVHDQTRPADKRITDIVNVGIGGSHLGPALVCDALRDFSHYGIDTHFISNIDGAAIDHVLSRLQPRNTLFVIASKSFTTVETLTNAESALHWFKQKGGGNLNVADHFIGVTSATEKAVAFGIGEHNIYPMWDWVGGRYSLWSAIGLPIALQFGFNLFEQLLAGGAAMDDHFVDEPLHSNLPATLALIGIWHRNFLGNSSRAVVPYDERLRLLPAFLQQLEMESNGKRVSRSDEPLPYDTAPVVWGGIGTDAQHAFFQLLHQGTIDVPVDFIVSLRPHHAHQHHHDLLFSNCIAQAEALMRGTGATTPAARTMPGNHSSNVLILEELNAFTLGALIAAYEHRTMFQGAIWNINSFDQFGVELGKRLATNIFDEIESNTVGTHDPSTEALIEHYLKGRKR